MTETPAVRAPQSRSAGWVSSGIRGAGVWLALAAALLVGLLLSPEIVASEQLTVIARQAAPLGLLALGQAVVVIGRGFDLSVGGVVAIVNVLAAGLVVGPGGATVVVAACLLVGAAVGAVNGIGVVLGRISPLIMTLGMTFVLSGAVLIFTGGAPTGNVPTEIRALSSARLAGIPVAVLIWLSVAIILAVVLRGSRPGRYLYARGSSPVAARLSGVPVARVELLSYVVSGVCAALGGVLLAGFVGSGSLGAGQDLMLQSLAAVVIGGITFVGGKGGVTGSVGGALFLTLVGALLTGLGAGKAGNLVAQGVVLAAAAALYRNGRVGQ